MAKAAFFFGSGISYDSCAASVSDITRNLLHGGWQYHTRDAFHPIAGPCHAEAKLAQGFLRVLLDYIDPHLFERENRYGHYEDLFAAAQQILWDFEGEIVNPLLGRVASDISQRTVHLWREMRPEGGRTPFSTLLERSCDLIQWAVFYGLVNTTKPVHMGVISDVAKVVDELDIFSLNHDILIERQLNDAGVAFADGFGTAPVSQFSWSWKDDGVRVRLYKLHGSINWYFYRSPKGFDQYFKVLNNDSEHAVDEQGNKLSLLETVPAVLTGTTVKERTYGFGLAGEHFIEMRNRLSDDSTLICCGYGWLDKGINIRINQWLRNSKKNRLVLLHAGDIREVRSKPVWRWRWENFEAAGQIVVIPKWLSECSVNDLTPHFF